MSDLINRQALCDDLQEYKVYPVPISSDESEVKGYPVLSDESEVKGYNDGIDLAISVIAEFPSAELEWKKGRWIDVTERIGFPDYKCSVCQSKSGSLWMNFCPNCGADMRGDHE